jgi:pimeloyl-ACP methyl ester carboxylesterase
MPLERVTVAPGVELACEIDDFCDAWSQPEAVILLHGIAETGRAFRPWSPHLARDLRVIRPDLRGFGASSPLGSGKPPTIAAYADEIAALVEQLQLRRVHLVGAKLGALIALDLAQRQPAWLASMTLAGVLISPGRAVGQWLGEWLPLIDREGVEAWARLTMPGRMGATLSAEAMEWWATYMGTAPAASVKACLAMLPSVEEPKNLAAIRCPTLVMVAVEPTRSKDYKQQQSVEDVKRWQSRIPGAELAELPADSYHIAATHPDLCAKTAREFIGGHFHA